MKLSECIAIGEFSSTGSGTTPPRQKSEIYYGGPIPWVKSGELREGLICATEETVTNRALQETPLKIAPKGALLVAMYGATVGRVARLNVPATTNQAICHIVPDPRRADEQYLFHALRAKAPELVARGVGGAQPNISQGTIKQTKIYLPPLPEQQRIAAILDQAEDLCSLRRQMTERLDEFRRAVFYDTFGDPVQNSRNWDDGKVLGDIADIASGITKGRKLSRMAVREVPYLAVSNVQDGHVKLDLVKTIDATETEISRYRLQKGDILLTEGGDPDKLGRGGIWHGEIAECIHQNHVFRVRITSSEIDALFLSLLIGSQRGKRYFLRSAKQTTGIASINMTQLRQFPLLLPPHSLQLRFKDMMRKINHQRQAIERASEDADALFNSLQHRAFTGGI